MPSTLYIEPFSGVAGDMLLSALCELADAYEDIASLPGLLGLPDGKIEIQTLNKNGITCRHIKIVDTSEAAHHHSHHHGPHRHLSQILALIDAARLTDGAKKIAKAIFQIIGESESRIHGIPIEKIHFHEVSGVDSILDIVGCAMLIDRLEIEKTYCDPICVGYGTVKTEHGILPVPAPATADILKGFPTYKGDEAGERCTPTGAAILRFLAPDFSPPSAAVQKIAYGPGQKDFASANVVRLSLLDPASVTTESIWVVETNIDDSSPELLGSDFQEGLLAAGAVDFYLTHVLMKKGRPGILLSALCHAAEKETVADYILENSTSIGTRSFEASRRILPRRSIAIESAYGTVQAKQSTLPSGKVKTKIEFEALKKLSHETGLSIGELNRRIKLD